MKITFKTESGSTYLLDKEAMTWERLDHAPFSNQLRTENGRLTAWPRHLAIGEPVLLFCPAYVEGADGRYIHTTPVTEIVGSD